MENVHSALDACSDIYKQACIALLGSSYGKPQVSRLHMTRASSYKGPHIRLRYPFPHHGPCIGVSALAHCLTNRIVVQKFNCRSCYRIWVLKGDQRTASIA